MRLRGDRRLIPLLVLLALPVGAGCGTAASPRTVPAAPAPPPRDDGEASQGGHGGLEHAQALEELKVSPLGWAVDRQNSVRVQLPDAPHWMRVRFWSVKSLVAFRYGKDHHAVIGGFILHVPDETAVGACDDAFQHWARPWVDVFEVEIEHAPPRATEWRGQIVNIDALVASTATLGEHDAYATAYATYPAWHGACLVLGVAVPARGEVARATAVRDRFATEILPNVQLLTKVEPTESY
jgi:hypothetical protein